MTPRRTPITRLLPIVLALCLVAGVAHAQEHVFQLSPSPFGFYLEVPVEAGRTEMAFKKEPPYAGEVIRGALPTGPAKKDHTGFAADPGADSVYFDQNRNLDLTDDPTTGRPPSRFTAPADAVRVRCADGDMMRTYWITPTDPRQEEWVESADEPWDNVYVISGWRQAIELNGAKWWLGVIDNLDGVLDKQDVLILAPGDDSAAGFDEPNHQNRLRIPERLFLNGVGYEMSFTFEPQDGKAQVIARFHESTPAMGELSLTGDSVARVILSGDWTVVLDNPAGPAPVPAGTYRSQHVCVADPTGYGSCRAILERDIVVEANQPVLLEAGGPIGPKIVANRVGRTLTLTPVLAGVGNERYYTTVPLAMLLAGDAPAFTVHQEGKEIAAGSFAYG